jgi:hypothetical protein
LKQSFPLIPPAIQVYFHLGELDDALGYAMGAGAHFNLGEKSLYVHTLVGKADGVAAISWSFFVSSATVKDWMKLATTGFSFNLVADFYALPCSGSH